MIYAHAYGYMNIAQKAAADYVISHLQDVQSTSRRGAYPHIVRMKNGDEHHFITYAGMGKWCRGRGEYVFCGQLYRNGSLVTAVMPKQAGRAQALQAIKEFRKFWRGENEC